MAALLNEGARVVEVSLDKIRRNEKQPRTRFDNKEIEALAASIKKHGVLQPIVLKPEEGVGGALYQVVAGERRLRAASKAGLAVIPAVVREVQERDKLEIALVENLQRVDLVVTDRARAYKRLVEEFGLTQQQVAEAVGKGRASIANTIRILELPAKAIEAIEQGIISEGHGRAILAAKGSGEREKALEKVVRLKLSVRDTEKLTAQTDVARSSPVNSGQAEKTGQPTREDDDAIRMLTEALGTKVEILRRVVGGRLMLHFYGEDDLQDLVDILTRKK
tara:strand:+ start:2983 stop:3816 length:834 start_codon:yes stop_codon:yes gene_type:complete